MPREADNGQQDYAVAAVGRAMDVVAALSRKGPATLTELAAEAGYTRVLVFRALHTLEGRGLVMQDGPRGRWRLGASWLGIARAAETQRALANAAAPHLRALQGACKETVLLAVRDGQESQIAAIDPPDPDGRTVNPVGTRGALHAGPARLLLAYAPVNLQRSVLASRLPRLTAATRIDPAAIAADLPRIRARGWLIAIDEVQEGLTSVSTGVRDMTGAVIAALTIQGPNGRMRAPRPHTLITPLMDAAAAIETVLLRFSER
jgi:DNA-binding IclR family transcriptional regulator